MKILADGQEILNISVLGKKILADDIHLDLLDEDIKRRIMWVINHKISKNVERLKKEWLPKLKDRGVESIPLDDWSLAELIFAQEDYKDAKDRNNGW